MKDRFTEIMTSGAEVVANKYHGREGTQNAENRVNSTMKLIERACKAGDAPEETTE